MEGPWPGAGEVESGPSCGPPCYRRPSRRGRGVRAASPGSGASITTGDESPARPEEPPAMISPFPGVDPFVEAQGYWPDFHPTFLNYWREAISDKLPDA